MRYRQAIGLGLLLVGFVSPAVAQDITIRAIDGKTGKPIPNEHLLVFLFEDIANRRGGPDLRTDANGIATLRAADLHGSYMQIWVDHRTQCNRNPNAQSLSILDIRAHGLDPENNCSDKIRNSPHPNELIVYARDPTLLERMVW